MLSKRKSSRRQSLGLSNSKIPCELVCININVHVQQSKERELDEHLQGDGLGDQNGGPVDG